MDVLIDSSFSGCKPLPLRALGLYMPGVYRSLSAASHALKFPAGGKKAAQSYKSVREGSRQLTGADIVDFLRDWGVKNDDVLMVHSSWENCAHLGISPTDFISTLKDCVSAGTLCMPTFPSISERSPRKVFSVLRTPSQTGLITEIFRRMPNVKRSCHMRSVSAWGKNADYLVSQHHESPYQCGEKSPFARFAELDAKVLCFGVPAVTNTMFHCGEDILVDKFPERIFPSGPETIDAEDAGGKRMTLRYMIPLPKWQYACCAPGMLKYFSSDVIRLGQISGVECSLTNASMFLKRLLCLATEKRIHMYKLLFPDLNG